MFTHKDIEMRTIFVVNCIEHDRSLRVNSGELMLEEIEGDKKRTLTKFPFQKLLALFIIGHITVTTPLIDKCKKYGVALVVMKPNLRPVFFWETLLKQIICFEKGSLNIVPKILASQNALYIIRC